MGNFMESLGKMAKEEGFREGFREGIERGKAKKEASLSANLAAIVEDLRQNVPFAEIQQKFGITNPSLVEVFAKYLL